MSTIDRSSLRQISEGKSIRIVSDFSHSVLSQIPGLGAIPVLSPTKKNE